MGSDQSSRREREERERAERARWDHFRAATATAATARDVEVALEQQRKLYEKKMKEVLEEQHKKIQKQKIDVLVVQATKSALDTTTKQQPQVLNSTNKLSAKPLTPASAAPQPRPSTSKKNEVSSTQNGSLVHQRTLYSQNQSEVQCAINEASPGPLYPNLGAYSSSQGNTASLRSAYSSPHGQSSPLRQPNSSPGYTESQGSSVYVNNNFKNNQQLVPRFSFAPSAPPSETSSTASSKNFRSRSQSRQRGRDDDIKCLTCGKIFGERIYQCNYGHSSCHLCKTRQVQCGQCHLQLTDRRNFDLEKYVLERVQKKVKCPNSDEGCVLYIKMADMENHEKNCPFKGVKCPSLGSCSWNGKLSQLSKHFDEMHPTHLQAEVDKEMFVSNICDTSHTMHYIRIGPYNFLFHIKVSEQDRRLYMATQLIGSKFSASKWEYEIHIYKKSEPRRKFQYIDRCSTSNEPILNVIKRTNCAVIPVEYANTLICGGVLTYKFYIRKDVKAKESLNNNKEDGPQRNQKKWYGKKN